MSAHYPFSLPPLPYPYDALAPQLDRVTLQLHHDRLFGSYTDSLNSLLASWPPYHDWPLPQLILRWPELPPDIRQAVRIAAGGVLAHTFVFESMTRPGTTQPDELLLGAIRGVSKIRYEIDHGNGKQITDYGATVIDTAVPIIGARN